MPNTINIDQLQTLLKAFAEERDWLGFHSPKNLAMAAAGEAGELLEIFQWMTEEASKNAHQDPELKQKIAHEIADITIYLIRLADTLDINLKDALIQKIAINTEKYPVEQVRGSAKKYTEYAIKK